MKHAVEGWLYMYCKILVNIYSNYCPTSSNRKNPHEKNINFHLHVAQHVRTRPAVSEKNVTLYGTFEQALSKILAHTSPLSIAVTVFHMGLPFGFVHHYYQKSEQARRTVMLKRCRLNKFKSWLLAKQGQSLLTVQKIFNYACLNTN